MTFSILALVALTSSIARAEIASSQPLVITVENLGSIAASILYVAWQRSYPQGGDWLARPSPDPGAVAVQLPPGFNASRAYDLVTRSDASLHPSGDGQVTYEVADNPVALLVTVGCP